MMIRTLKELQIVKANFDSMVEKDSLLDILLKRKWVAADDIHKKLEAYVSILRHVKADVELKNCFGDRHSKICQQLTKLQLAIAKTSDSIVGSK